MSPCLRLPIRPRGSESLRKLSSQTKKVLNKKEKIYGWWRVCELYSTPKRDSGGTRILQFHKYPGNTWNVPQSGGWVCPVSTMVALAGSTKPERDMSSNCREFYRETKRIKDKNISQRSLHQELKQEGLSPRFLSKLKLFRKNNPEQPPT